MRVCVACRNYVLLPDGNVKREEPEWLSIHQLCPKCQVKKGALQIAKQRKKVEQGIASNE